MLIDTRNKLSTCDITLQGIVRRAVDTLPFDVCVCCGHRGKQEQDSAFATGNSKVKFPNSRHNSFPSEAVDLAPINGVTLDWDVAKMRQVAQAMQQAAEDLGTTVVWGGDWKMRDNPHFQLGD